MAARTRIQQAGYRVVGRVYDRVPAVRPAVRRINRALFSPPTRFFGWGMRTEHALPWDDRHQWASFRDAAAAAHNFEFSGGAGITNRNIDGLMWRHWNIAFAVRYAIRFNSSHAPLSFVECGVADGATAFFALSELQSSGLNHADFHLYDAWDTMLGATLTESERTRSGTESYSGLSIDVAKRNLRPFGAVTTYHQGYIPASLSSEPAPPEAIAYLHLDLNAAKATNEALEFFHPRCNPRAIAVFDDYGHRGYEEQKEVIDAFYADKPGVLMKQPTGQALFFKEG